MQAFLRVRLKSVTKYKLLIGIMLFIVACSSGNKLEKAQSIAKKEKLNIDLSISLFSDYEGPGFVMTGDAKGFKKRKQGGKVRLLFENTEELGIALKSFPKGKLPFQLEGLPRKIEINENIVYYYNPDNGMTDLNSNGVVFALQGDEYTEVLYVSYQSKFQVEVQNILASIEYTESK